MSGSLLLALLLAAPPATTVAVPVDWAAAKRALTPGVVSPPVQAQVDRLPLPVLLPIVPELLDRLVLTHGPEWYAASLHGPGVDVSLHAFGRANPVPALLPIQRKAGFGDGTPRFTVVDAIRSASFERFGVAYTLDVECATADKDPRCADDDYLRSLLAALVMVGGGQ